MTLLVELDDEWLDVDDDDLDDELLDERLEVLLVLWLLVLELDRLDCDVLDELLLWLDALLSELVLLELCDDSEDSDELVLLLDDDWLDALLVLEELSELVDDDDCDESELLLLALLVDDELTLEGDDELLLLDEL